MWKNKEYRTYEQGTSNVEVKTYPYFDIRYSLFDIHLFKSPLNISNGHK